MTPHDLIQAFDILADAPEGVARLRELVLQLAVQGKLVPQDAEDEPARVLLERIGARGKFASTKRLAPVSEGEVPFEVPKGWTWVRAEQFFSMVTSGSRGWATCYSENGPLFRDNKIIAFELYLRQTTKPEAITSDELLERAKYIVDSDEHGSR